MDQACSRDFGLLSTDASGFFSEEKHDCASIVETLEDGVPLTNTHHENRYRAIKHIVTKAGTEKPPRRGGQV